MATHIVTQIKRQVQEAKMRQYSINKDKKQLRYYSLYLKQIIKIQRYYRKHLTHKTRALQQEVSCLLQKKQLTHFTLKSLTSQLCSQLQKRIDLETTSLQKTIKCQKQEITLQMKDMIKNVVNCADRYAKNVALSNVSITDLQELLKQERELEVQVRELQLQKQCYQQRIELWEGKLRDLRSKVMGELSQRRKLERELRDLEEEQQQEHDQEN